MNAEDSRLSAQEIATSILGRVAADLSMIVDRDLQIDAVRAERRTERPAGEKQVHISFKLGIELNGQPWQGCLLVPLPDAIALAGFMMMMPDDAVQQERLRTELDDPFKEALLEVGKFIAGACDSVLRQALSEECVTRSEGCQGVRPDVRPALEYREGDELMVAEAKGRVHDFEPFDMLLVLPAFEGSATREFVSG